MEGVMRTFLVSAFAAIVLSAAFLADAVAAYPPNDWHRVDTTRF
jgi:hypothetical protein